VPHPLGRLAEAGTCEIRSESFVERKRGWEEQPMSNAEDEAVVAAKRLADSCADVLRSCLVSAILHGSLTLDDFQPGKSDLDLLLVVERDLADVQIDALVAAVREADVGPAAGIDLLVVTRESAAAPADHPRRELLVGRYPGPSDGLEVDRRDDHAPDVWPELSVARAHGYALLGTEPREVLGEVPVGCVRANGLSWLTTWLELTDDDANAPHMVLTACRIWKFAVAGEHSSKSAAAHWALHRDPSLLAIEKALSGRAAAKTAHIPPVEVERVLVRVLRDVEGDAQHTE
jgi:predicted nucleotidyltransferase